MTSFDYLFKASLYLLLFYGCYWLLLRRTTFFALNRAYLLGALVVALLLPFAEVPEQATTVRVMTLPTIVVGTESPATVDSITFPTILGWLYRIGVVIMLLRLALQLRAVFRLIGHGQVEKQATYILVRLPDDAVPSFSFGRYLVLNQTDTLNQPDALMRHEEAHIRQRHTVDVLFVELIRAAFWFNPVLWLYKCALQEVHEFLADRVVSRSLVDQPDYARLLVSYALDVPTAALTTPFVSFSNLKRRIYMLQKPATSRRALISYAAILIPTALLWMCTQTENDVKPLSETLIKKQNNLPMPDVNDEIFTVVEKQPEFPGGMEELTQFISQNLRYPEAAQKAKVQGRVFVSFVVNKEGAISDVQILKGMGFGTDEEAIRVVKQMPRWKPGSQDSQPVNVRFNLPIQFNLESEVVTSANSSSDDMSELRKRFSSFKVNGRESTAEDFAKLSASSTIKHVRLGGVDSKGRRTIEVETK